MNILHPVQEARCDALVSRAVRKLSAACHDKRISARSDYCSTCGVENFDPGRLRAYAMIFMAVEEDSQSSVVSSEHALRARNELAGELNGIAGGYTNESEKTATRAYMRGRESSNWVHGPANSARLCLRKLVRALEANYTSLPLHIRPFAPKVTRMFDEVEKLWRWTAVQPNFLQCEIGRKQPSVSSLTLLYWNELIGQHRQKWRDMHRLAGYWNISRIVDHEQFRHHVHDVRKKLLGKERDRLELSGRTIIQIYELLP